MAKDIITIERVGLTQDSFKDERLAQATSRIFEIYAQACEFVEEKNRDISKVLSVVKNEKSYVEDGFKSVADYAEKVFGIKKQNAYALASAGDVYNDENASEELKAFSPSKVAELAKVDRDKVEAAITNGDITPETTQKELREKAKELLGESPKTEIVKEYTARIVGLERFNPFYGVDTDSLMDTLSVPRSVEEWDEWFTTALNDTCAPTRQPEVVKLPKCAAHTSPNSNKKTVQRHLYVSESFAVTVEFYIYVPPKAANKGMTTKPHYTKEQLLAMLEALEMEDGDTEG